MNRKLALALVVPISILVSSSALAAPITDADDSLWFAGPGLVGFEIVAVSGSLAASGNLEFGIYDPTDLSETIVFDNGYVFGDTAGLGSIGTEPFGFFLTNTGTGFGGPYTRYSDSTLNTGGLDAMLAEFGGGGGGSWEVEFEDLDFVTIGGSGSGDLRVRISNIAPVPEPGTFALLGLGLVGLGLVRRRKKLAVQSES